MKTKLITPKQVRAIPNKVLEAWNETIKRNYSVETNESKFRLTELYCVIEEKTGFNNPYSRKKNWNDGQRLFRGSDWNVTTYFDGDYFKERNDVTFVFTPKRVWLSSALSFLGRLISPNKTPKEAGK